MSGDVVAAYYNEFDKHAAAWLRQLIKLNLIADGEVDERSIVDVSAEDLKGFTQHHFFAGIGGWSYALRLAEVLDTEPVWTASLPCQPFSAAGKQLGKSDERHLLPHFIELVRQCRPKRIFGEQVPGAIRHGWLDDLHTEMEQEDYSVRSCVLTAAGAGAYHIRQRLYWVADSYNEGLQRRSRATCPHKQLTGENSVANQWSNPDWIYCRDNKYRPIKPSLKPLADGVPRGVGYSCDPSSPITPDETQEARVMRLKGYGNAIVPQVAAVFIRASCLTEDNL